jgi:hypothetical protein
MLGCCFLAFSLKDERLPRGDVENKACVREVESVGIYVSLRQEAVEAIEEGM